MVRTGALSRRWRRLWTRSPILHFTRNFSSLSSIPLPPHHRSHLRPHLESLSLSKARDVTRLIVSAPNLRHLMVYDCGSLRRVEVVEAPPIWRLMYSGDVSKIGDLEGKVPMLDEVALLSTEKDPFKNPVGCKCLVGAVAHARVLTFSNWFFKFTFKDFGPEDQDFVFKNLKELHWWPAYQKSPWDHAEPWSAHKISTNSLHALLSLLRHCPSLEELCIRATYNMEHEDDMSCFSHRRYHTEQLPPLNIDSVGYELPCLKTVNITESSGSKVEMRLIKFLAEKAAALDSVTLHYVEDIKFELEGIREDLTSIRTASPRARILFSEFDEDKVCPKHEDMWYNYMII